MKRIKATKTIPYAHDGAPHLDHVNLVEGEEIEVTDSMALSIIANEHGHLADSVADTVENKVVEPESKEKGLDVDDKEQGKKGNKQKNSK